MELRQDEEEEEEKGFLKPKA